MRLVLSFVLCVFYFLVSAQSETHDYITYDTTIAYKGRAGQGGGSNVWQIRITRPRDYFTAGNPDTASRRIILTMPGAGQVGTDTNFLVQYGPHYWLLNGWDGSIVTGNGTHYPIYITAVQATANTRPWYTQCLIDTLLKYYHPKGGKMSAAGFSQGSYEWGECIKYAQFAGDEHGMNQFNCWADLEGVAPADNFSGFDITPYQAGIGHWANKYGGRMFGLEGTNDTRNVWVITQNINDSVSSKPAYFTWQNDGGGTHCCWNDFYNPFVTNWQNITIPFGNSYITTKNGIPNTIGNYYFLPSTGSNIFQWMFRQGDTTLIGGCAPLVDAGPDQTFFLPTNSTALAGSSSGSCGHTIASNTWSQLSGPNTASFSSTTSLTPTVSGLIAGIYLFQLRTVDNTGLASSNTVQIGVNATQTPTVSAGNPQTVILPASTATISGTASGNGGATISSTLWTQTSGPNTAAIATPASLTTNLSGLIRGAYVFTLTATDNHGNSNSDNVTVSVQDSLNVSITPYTWGLGEYQAFVIDTTSGQIHAFGTNYNTLGVGGTGLLGSALLVKTPGGVKFRYVAGGLHGGMAITTTDSVYAWGDNNMGQCGIGTIGSAVLTPVKVTQDSIGNSISNVSYIIPYYAGNAAEGWYMLKKDGSLHIVGNTKGCGMRGDGTFGDTSTRFVQVPIPGGRIVKQMVAGSMLMILCTDSTVWTCGNGNQSGVPGNWQNLGYTGSGNQFLTLTQLTSLTGITQIAGGINYQYALRRDGKLFGFGFFSNNMGAGATSGYGTPYAVPTELINIENGLPKPINSIVTNSSCTHVILSDSSLWGWGENAQAGVGNGVELNFNTWSTPYFFAPGSPGTLVQPTPVQLTNKYNYTAIFGSMVFCFYTVAETSDGQNYSWGRNKGAVCANGVIPCSTNQDATYPNGRDVTWVTPIDPLHQTTVWSTICFYCIANSGATDCGTCTNPSLATNANAGADQNIQIGTATLSGAASVSSGNINYYLWTQTSGPNTATMDINTGKTVKLSNLQPGTYVFKLSVTDNAWNTSTDNVTVTIGNSCNCLIYPLPVIVK